MTVAHSESFADCRGSAHRAGFSAKHISGTIVQISAVGEIDACNALDLVVHTERHLVDADELILDLTGIIFFGTQGFSTLHQLNVITSREGVNWVLVPSAEVTRLLAVCDPAGGLPVAADVAEAVVVLRRGPRSHLAVVPKPE